MYTHLLVRGGELFLKGKNYVLFEQRLKRNISTLTKIELKKITSLRGRFILPFSENHHLLKRVFGLVSYSPTIRVEAKMKTILSCAVTLLNEKKGTFKVDAKRSDKRFPIQSPEVSRQLGQFIENNTALSFQRENPDFILHVEINNDGAYLFLETIPCFGGLPTGSEGPVFLLVEDETSILAGLLMMKRGISIIPIGFREEDISLLQRFSPSTLILRVIDDFSDLERLSRKGTNILVTGETFETLNSMTTSLLILRPLVAFDSETIKEKILQYQHA
ncbi:hypothetical protein HYT55_03310 [Candidatus Woesearchaeota archaeon]|nr:hypothetical protein [Candidatus Woesearchaeota archaeon]